MLWIEFGVVAPPIHVVADEPAHCRARKYVAGKVLSRSNLPCHCSTHSISSVFFIAFGEVQSGLQAVVGVCRSTVLKGEGVLLSRLEGGVPPLLAWRPKRVTRSRSASKVSRASNRVAPKAGGGPCHGWPKRGRPRSGGPRCWPQQASYWQCCSCL